MTGTIIRLIDGKGFGFLRDEEGNERFMCAADCKDPALWRRLREKQRVYFIPTTKDPGDRKGPKDNGLRCANIEVLS